MCVRFFGPMGLDVAPFLVRGDWGIIWAVWTPEIDDVRPDLWGVGLAQKPYRRRPLGTNENIYLLLFGGSKIPSKAPPRGPESTPRAQKRGPRADPNDSRVG